MLQCRAVDPMPRNASKSGETITPKIQRAAETSKKSRARVLYITMFHYYYNTKLLMILNLYLQYI